MPKTNSVVHTSQYFHLLIFTLIFLFFLNSQTVKAEEKDQRTSESKPAIGKVYNAYCGISCVYAVMKLNGKQTSFSELVKPEYVRSAKGSSLKNLQKAAEDNGLYAIPVGKLTTRMLLESPYPIILHVKSAADSEDYDHFELFLGTENGQARLFDPPEAMKLGHLYELAPRWDGTGLIVSAGPIELETVLAPARNRFIMCAAIAIAIVLLLHLGRRRWPLATLANSRSKLFGLSIVQAMGFGILALVCGMVYHFANDEGFLAHANATTSVQQSHIGNFIPKVSKGKVERLLGTDTVFIDARFARDFKAGHMEGAISVPVDANDTERYKATAGIGKDAPIVIYCQSAGCKFAEKVTIKLQDDGFRNISIFKGGWNEWKGKKDD